MPTVYIIVTTHTENLFYDVICDEKNRFHELAYLNYSYANIATVSFVCFDLILYVPLTIFQLNRKGSSWVEPLLS